MIDQTLFRKIEQTSAQEHWKKIGIKKHHGFCTPLFSLRSENSLGIGEFLDLIPLVQWCAKVGMDVIQLLPINDSGTEKSPYSAISSLALNPIYISIYALKKNKCRPDLINWIQKLKNFEDLPIVSYHDVRELKLKYLYTYYKCKNTKAIYKKQVAKFVKENEWVKVYALFRVLKNEHDQKAWFHWPKEYHHPTQKMLALWIKKHRKKIDFECFLQYVCFLQMRKVKRIAQKKKIFIKGDLPILLSRDSVDVWIVQEAFLKGVVAGAPPDRFNRQGQNWGFPIFNWKKMSKDGHRWWKKRLEVAQTLYHIYRIDHAVGFFRIWGVGPGKDPMQGHFIPKDQESWEENGKRIFSMMLQFTNMLPIAEDLGIVPLNIRKAIKKMGICGTCVVRSMYHSTNKRFFTEGKDYHPLSMATLGTHDMLPMSIWYQSYPRLAKRFAKFIGVKYDRKWSKKHQFKALAFSHKTKSAFTINLLDEYLCLEEAFCIHPEEGRRINHPGTLLESNWTYRIPYTLEKITKHEKLNQKLCQLTK